MVYRSDISRNLTLEQIFWWASELLEVAFGSKREELSVSKSGPLIEPRNHVVQLRRFGSPEGLEVVESGAISTRKPPPAAHPLYAHPL